MRIPTEHEGLREIGFAHSLVSFFFVIIRERYKNYSYKSSLTSLRCISLVVRIYRYIVYVCTQKNVRSNALFLSLCSIETTENIGSKYINN